MGKTSSEVKNRYNKKTYTPIVVSVKKETAEAYKKKCDDMGISYSQVLHQAIGKFLEEEKENKCKEYISKLKELDEKYGGFDEERLHAHADGLLCELLAELGYNEVVEEFDKLDKWYT